MTRRPWLAYGILIAGCAWFILMASGLLRHWAQHVSLSLPHWLVLTAVLGTPVLAALCTINLGLDIRARAVALLLLLVSVPLLPFAFDSHPLLVTAIVFGTLLEVYVVPRISRKWISSGPGAPR